MVSKKQLQKDLEHARRNWEIAGESANKNELALRQASVHMGCHLSHFGMYSLEDFIKDLGAVASEKTAAEARKRLGLDKPKEPEMSKVEKGLREIADLSTTHLPTPDYYKDLGIKREEPKKDLDALKKRVAYLENKRTISIDPKALKEAAKVIPIGKRSARALAHGVPQSYREGGFTKQPKPRYRLEAIPCTKPQEYTVVRIEEEK